MKADLKEKWLAALQGGEYKQTRGELRGANVVEYMAIEAGASTPDGWTNPSQGGAFSGFVYRGTPGLGHCCLGVLADIMYPGGWTAPSECESDEDDSDDCPCSAEWEHEFDNGEKMLSDGALAAAYLNEDEQNELAQMNDGGKDFATIAAYIKENL